MSARASRRNFVATYGSTAVDEIDALIDFVRGVEHFASTTHFFGAQLVEVVGDEACVETPAFITHREAPRPGEKRGREWVAQTRYRERYVRVEGRWRIAELGGDAPAVPTGRAEPPRSDDPVVRRLLDRAAIHDVVTTSAIAADRGDATLLSSCFATTGCDRVGGDRAGFVPIARQSGALRSTATLRNRTPMYT